LFDQKNGSWLLERQDFSKSHKESRLQAVRRRFDHGLYWGRSKMLGRTMFERRQLDKCETLARVRTPLPLIMFFRNRLLPKSTFV